MEARTPLEAFRWLEWARALVEGVAIGPGLTHTRADELATFLQETYPDLPVVVVEDGAPVWDLTEGLRAVAQCIPDLCADSRAAAG